MGISEEFKRLLAEAEIELEDPQINKMISYMREILKINENINLTAIRDEKEFLEKQLLDSLMILDYAEVKKANRIIDIGTGAGFPGIPLAIALPNTKFVLVDSLNKRLKVIDSLCEELEIDNVKTIHGRAESLGHDKDHREKYDICVSKAVAPLGALVEYCLPFVKVGGKFYAYKTDAVKDEMSGASRAAKILGAGEGVVIKAKYEGTRNLNNHNFITFKKTANTSGKYPRKEGVPTRKPI